MKQLIKKIAKRLYEALKVKEPEVVLCARCKIYKPIQTQDMGDEFCFICITKIVKEALDRDK